MLVAAFHLLFPKGGLNGQRMAFQAIPANRSGLEALIR
ncbi:hypothetical protein EV13_2012 [Prochlorococcus sp. MIT 0702]|nr:hypothetical protein EV13_2012 [Prochlorococcus sp. MIT 0702]KGG28171.1 hypothetical protein EV12_0921 [Prochlorococcus sp. MIT 0701]KGG37221.1 hypothetical protein EV14_0013 [Prochlorococcus sp. MIT 0703]